MSQEYSYNEPTRDLPLKIFEAPPPYGKRIVTLQIELEGTEKASLVFAGKIYEFRDRLQAKEIPGGFPGGEGEEKGKYARVMKSVDVSQEAEVDKADMLITFVCDCEITPISGKGYHNDTRHNVYICSDPRRARGRRT